MKPDFALSLSFEGLRLLTRAPEGWLLVGEVGLDDDDLSGALAELRARGEAIADGPFATKLLLPNEQIKYIALDTTRTDEEDVRAALDGATPYALDDLAYDFTKGGGRTYIAAVARETLAEAEAFAREHGFTPAGFAAVPAPFTYIGEPVFGALDGYDAETLREPDPIEVVGNVPADAVQTPEPVSEAPAEEHVHHAGQAETVDAAKVDAQDALAPDDPAEDANESDPESVQDDATPLDHGAEETGAPVFGSARRTAPPAPDLAPEAEPEPQAQTAPVPDTEPADEDAADAPSDEDRPDAITSTDTAIEAEDRAPADPEPAPVFGTRRSGDLPLHGAPSRKDPPPLAVPVAAPDHGPRLGAAARDQSEAAPAVSPLRALPPEPAESAPPVGGSDIPDSAPPVPAPEPDAAPAALAATLAPASTTEPGGFRSRRKPGPTKADPATGPKERSFFNARRKAPEPKVVGGKPRFLGLILTAALILVLLLIGLFMAGPAEVVNSLFRRNAVPDAPQPELVASAPASPEAPAAGVPAQPDLAAAPQAAAPQTTAPLGPVLSPDEAARIYAATGVWQRAPRLPVEPRIDPLGEIAITTIPEDETTRLAQPDAPLPDGLVGDTIFPTPIAPPPPEAEFDFDASGYVVATPDGAMTPDGVLVFADSPDLLPPVRPGTEAPPATVPLAEGAVPVEDAPDGVVLISGAPALTPPVRQPIVTEDTAPTDEVAASEDLADPGAETPASGEAAIADAPQQAPDEAVVYLSERPALVPAIRPASAVPATDAASPVNDAGPENAVVLITERPDLVPAVRPAALVPEAPENSTEDPAEIAEDAVALVQRPGPDTLRPGLRPETLAAAAAQVPEPDPSLPAIARDAPPARPASLVPPAPEPDAPAEPEPEPAAQPASPASLELNAALAAAVAEAANRPNAFVAPTPQAVAASVRPDARPRNMDRIVSAAVAQQQRQATAEPIRPAATARPSGPTATTVARAATMENAINLRDINLIGVFNRNDGRYALVRLANGRLQEVRVGDRLDGGQVTAISDDALNYVKRGRTITLQIPSG